MNKGETSRNLLPYFLDSRIWKNYLVDVVKNYQYWKAEDPVRASKYFSGYSKGMIGTTVQDHIYDMVNCVYSAKLSAKTKSRLYSEIDELEKYHEAQGTIGQEI